MEKDLPASVKKTVEFFDRNRLWYSLTWNHGAMSCADAANKRNRLGNTGIPLCDELKSSIGYYFFKGEKRYLLLHCRGNQRIDEKKVNALLSSEFVRLPVDELLSTFNCEYGLVNPFLFGSDFPEIEQVFDQSVLEDYFPPYTMITNAGDKNWGIEFKAGKLVDTLQTSRVIDVITEDSRIKIRKHKVGILTGNSPESGIFLWQKLNEAIRTRLQEDFLGDLSFPTVMVESMPEMGLSMELDNREEETWRIVEEGITSLCKDGATIVGMACNTTQYFSEKVRTICESFGAEYLSMADAVNTYLTRNKIEHFDFIGIKFVTDFEKWSAYSELNARFDVKIPSQSELEQISTLAFEVKKKLVTSKGINSLRERIRNSARTKNIIIALTEISILLASQKQRPDDDKRYIDTLTLLANKMADRYLRDYSEMLLLNQSLSEEGSDLTL